MANIIDTFTTEELDNLRAQDFNDEIELCEYCSRKGLELTVEEASQLFDYLFGEDDLEPHGSHDCSDDAEALASAGFGTDEDYGCYGGGEDY